MWFSSRNRASRISLVHAAYAIGNVIALLVFGRVSDRIGRHRTTLPAIVVGALVLLLAEQVVSLYVGRILIGTLGRKVTPYAKIR
jgi:MFS family permease